MSPENLLAQTQQQLDGLNAQLRVLGLLELIMIDPKKLKGQRVNARYMKAETMNRLRENIKKAGTLESLPLVYLEEGGDYYIISGHHRVEAACEAQLPLILALVDKPASHDEVVSKQLAHNSLSGEDDKVLLAELFKSIQDIEWRMRSGLNDEIGKISYDSLSFKLAALQEFMVLFIPEDIEKFDEVMEQLAGDVVTGSRSVVRMAPKEDWKRFAEVLRKVKKFEDIKSNGIALGRMVELAAERIEQLKKEAVDGSRV